MNAATPKSQARRDAILAAIATRAHSTNSLAATLGAHSTCISGYLRQMREAGLVRIHKELKLGTVTRFYWIAASAPEDAPWGDDGEDDIEDMIARDVKKKLAKIQPHRDWSQFWIPVREAA